MFSYVELQPEGNRELWWKKSTKNWQLRICVQRFFERSKPAIKIVMKRYTTVFRDKVDQSLRFQSIGYGPFHKLVKAIKFVYLHVYIV